MPGASGALPLPLLQQDCNFLQAEIEWAKRHWRQHSRQSWEESSQYRLEMELAQRQLKRATEIQKSAMAEEGSACSFTFIRAELLRKTADFHEMPVLQRLRREYSEWLVELVVSIEDAVSSRLVGKVLAVSHRWEQPGSPDPYGEQLRVIQRELRKNPNIELVWIDVRVLDSNPLELGALIRRDRRRRYC